MALTTSADTKYTSLKEILNSTTLPQLKHLCSVKKAKDIVKKKFLRAHIILKLKKKVMNQENTSPDNDQNKIVIRAPIPMPTSSLIAYPYQDYVPLTITDLLPMSTPLFAIQPVPVVLPSPGQILATHICPFAGTVVQPILPIVPQTFIPNDLTNIASYINEYNFTAEPIEDITDVISEHIYMPEKSNEEFVQTKLNEAETIEVGSVSGQNDPIEVYLSLPKGLFPTARMVAVDPNQIIDEFCKMPNLQRHAPWLLDLEFGFPKTLITRPLPIYNVKFNSIHCKNTPDAIHPGFESCTPDFKRALLFYYDCIVSAWYRGYIIATSDRSVENFQSWLLLPMQVLGMCWP